MSSQIIYYLAGYVLVINILFGTQDNWFLLTLTSLVRYLIFLIQRGPEAYQGTLGTQELNPIGSMLSFGPGPSMDPPWPL